MHDWEKNFEKPYQNAQKVNILDKRGALWPPKKPGCLTNAEWPGFGYNRVPTNYIGYITGLKCYQVEKKVLHIRYYLLTLYITKYEMDQ